MRAPLALSVVAALVSPAAHAADCAAPYAVDQLLADLVAIEGHLRSGDDTSASTAATSLESGLACMNEVLPRMIVGRAYRAVGAGLVAGGNAERGTTWLRTAAEIEQSFEYGIEDLPPDHPVRDAYANAKLSSSGDELAVAGATFGAGTAWLDGRKIEAPEARVERPHLFQLDDGGVKTWIIDGNAFPASVLAAVADAGGGADDGKAPKEKKEKVPKEKAPKDPKVAKSSTAMNPDGTLQVKRQRPWEKTPLMIGGATLGAVAGGVYYLSSVKRREFNDATTLRQIQDLQPQVNRLVVVSAAVFAVGTGTLTWGVILDGGAPVPAVRVRF